MKKKTSFSGFPVKIFSIYLDGRDPVVRQPDNSQRPQRLQALHFRDLVGVKVELLQLCEVGDVLDFLKKEER